MFKNISKILKTFAYINIIVAFFLFFISAVLAIVLKNNVTAALVFVALAFNCSWLPSILLYALGEIVEKLTEIAQHTKNTHTEQGK